MRLVSIIIIFILATVYVYFHGTRSSNQDVENEETQITLEKDQTGYDQDVSDKEDKTFITQNYTSKTEKITKSTTKVNNHNSTTNTSSLSSDSTDSTTSTSKDEPASIPASVIDEHIKTLSKKIPLTHVKVSDDSSQATEISLNLNTLKKDTCHMGDLDLITQDLEKADLVLSVENILPSDTSFTPVIQFLSPNSLEHGSFYFTLPRVNNPVFLGLFLCKDSSNSRRCNNKSVQPISELLNIQSSGVKITNPKYTKDKVYFFQSFILTHNDIYILDTNQVNKHGGSLKNTLISITGMSEDKVTPVVNRLKSINKKILSENVTTTKNSINLILPKYSIEACNAKANLQLKNN